MYQSNATMLIVVSIIVHIFWFPPAADAVTEAQFKEWKAHRICDNFNKEGYNKTTICNYINANSIPSCGVMLVQLEDGSSQHTVLACVIPPDTSDESYIVAGCVCSGSRRQEFVKIGCSYP